MLRFLVSALVLSLLSTTTLAHNVVASVWLDGNVIEGEVGLSNGQMAQVGTVVVVTDPEGNSLGEVKVGQEGLFRFQPTKSTVHIFTVNLGAGHVAQTILSQSELPETLRSTKSTVTPKLSTRPAVTDNDALKTMIAKAVRQEVQPLRKEIARYKEKNDLQTILGGIGYILGLSGVAFYIMARRRKGDDE